MPVGHRGKLAIEGEGTEPLFFMDKESTDGGRTPMGYATVIRCWDESVM
jgi:hypothetical protein